MVYNPHAHYHLSTFEKLCRRFTLTPYYSSPSEYVGYRNPKYPEPRPAFSAPMVEDQEPVTESTSIAAVPPPKCLITTLATEILQQISSYLIIESKICLSLTCKTILHAIGNETWVDPCITGRWSLDHPGDIIHRVSLLCFLARDLEDWSYCSSCKVLHKSLPPPREFGRARDKDGKRCTDSSRGLGKWIGRDCTGMGVMDHFPKVEHGGYALTFEHVRQALGPIQDCYSSDPIPMMEDSYTIQGKWLFSPRIKYDITFSARRLGKPLVFKQIHRFSLDPSDPLTGKRSKRGLWPSDITTFPLRICPHHTTSPKICTDPNTYAFYWDIRKQKWRNRKWYNGPLLTHSITSVFPTYKRVRSWFWFLRPKFRVPTMSEENQMNMEEKNREDGLWWCRSCPTKWKVQYKAAGERVEERVHGRAERDLSGARKQGDEETEEEVIITVYQSLGTNEETARTAWKALVRRERNTAFGSESRTFPLFRCE